MTRPLIWPATRRALAFALLLSAAAFTVCASAQIATDRTASTPVPTATLTAEYASVDLPEAPGTSPDSSGTGSSSIATDPLAPSDTNLLSSRSSSGQMASSLPEAPSSDRYPLPGQPTSALTSAEKVRMGFTGAFSIYSVFGWFSSAGYEQLTNGSPNFGTDRGAFGQRLWTSAARATSENLLSDSVFAPIFHEDPRYYRMGSTHKFFPRLVYSATRSIITRSDSGRTVPNYSQIFGNAAGSAITYAYYPDVNRTAKDTAETFGSSLGGTALGDVIAEFFGRFLYKDHR